MRGIVQGSAVTGVGDATAGDVAKGKTCTVNAGSITGTLELTGNADVTDVADGKTFYKDGLKTKLTGTLKPTSTDIKPGVTIAGVLSTMTDNSGTFYGITYANQTLDIPEGYDDGTESAVFLQIATPGNNQVYYNSNGTTSATYAPISSATVNYRGSYKVTIVVSVSGSFDAIGVKVQGVERTYAEGTFTFNVLLEKGDTFLVEGYVETIYGSTLTVATTVGIAEPTAFIA